MRSTWRLGRILGIQVNIDPSWLIIFFLLLFSLGGVFFPQQLADKPVALQWALGLAATLLVFASVLAHELTHSLVAIHQGEKVRSITLFLFGGVAQITEEPDRPFKEFTMAIVGPLSSLFMAIVFGIVWFFFRDIYRSISILSGYLAIINLFLAGFNLIPGFPLDGGRVLRAIIWGITGNLKLATRVASFVGQLVAFVLIFFGIQRIFSGIGSQGFSPDRIFNGLWLIFIGWFLHSSAVRGYHQVMLREMLRDLHAEDLMSRAFETISGNLSLQKLVEDHILGRHQHTFVVTDEGQLKGIVSLRDMKKVPREQWPDTTVEMVMTPKETLATLSPQDNGSLILQRIMSAEVEQLPVLEKGRVVGIVHRNHILHRLRARTELGV